MSRLTKASVEQARQEGYAHGFAVGVGSGRRAAMQEVDLRKAQISLINAVGQTLQTQASLIQGLGQVFDCGPRT